MIVFVNLRIQRARMITSGIRSTYQQALANDISIHREKKKTTIKIVIKRKFHSRVLKTQGFDFRSLLSNFVWLKKVIQVFSDVIGRAALLVCLLRSTHRLKREKTKTVDDKLTLYICSKARTDGTTPFNTKSSKLKSIVHHKVITQ